MIPQPHTTSSLPNKWAKAMIKKEGPNSWKYDLLELVILFVIIATSVFYAYNLFSSWQWIFQ